MILHENQILKSDHELALPGENPNYFFSPQWWFLPVLGGEMQRLNAYRFYDLGMKVHPLTTLDQKSGNNRVMLISLLVAREEIERFLTFLPFRVCESAAKKLLEAIDSIIPKDPDTGEVKRGISSDVLFGGITADYYQTFSLVDNAKKFETILSAEIPTLDTYFVSQKGAYSTPDLIERAEVVFSESIRHELSAQTIFDVREAGRCLVLNSPTAAGFHILRATESVIREYLAVVTKGTSKSKHRNWGAYIRALTGAGVDPKITSMLDQIRDMHRNPLMHPEDSLSNEEAVELFDICKSAIQTIVRDMVKRKSASLLVATPSTSTLP
jgi:hypothetical protein